METIDEFLAELASEAPVPGGGSVAGLELAMGCALIVMVCDLTLGREKFAGAAETISTIRGRASALQEEGRQLMTTDAEAFGKVAKAMKLPRTSEQEKADRRRYMQEALKEAVMPPLMTMRLSGEAIQLAEQLAPVGNPSAVSDVGSAALALDAAFYAAMLNVEINLAAIKDEEFNQSVHRQMPQTSVVDASRVEVMRLVRASIGGAG